jgi:hypothetical protein
MSDVPSGNTSAGAKDVTDDLAALESDVGSLIKEMKDLAFREGSRLGQNAAGKISGCASDIYSGVSKQTIRSAEVVSEHVQDWPVSSLVCLCRRVWYRQTLHSLTMLKRHRRAA